MLESKDIAQLVYTQLVQDFPPHAVEWVLDKSIRWEGPTDVPIQHVDFDNYKSWSAFHDDAKIAKFQKKIRRGKLKPVILVDRPHKTNLMVVDGHHRSLASRKNGQTVRAYVAHVPTEIGPWDELHASQNRLQPPKPVAAKDVEDKSPSDLTVGAVIVIDDGRGKVLATTRDGKKDDLDLPGGRLEEGETPEEAAIRETEEETGVKVTKVEQLYSGPGSKNRKHVTIYRALEHNALSLEKFKPEKGEDVRWVEPKDLAAANDTFGAFTRAHFDQIFGYLHAKLSDKIPTDATLPGDSKNPSIPAPPGWLEEMHRGFSDYASGKTTTMPFVSEAQRSYLEIHHPKVAEEFAKHTAPGAKLPQHVKADIGPSAVHTDGLSGGYRLETATEKNPKVPDLAGVVTPAFQQPNPPAGTDVTSPNHVPRWPLSNQVNMISAAKRKSLPSDKFALPELKKYPIDTAARVRNAAARLEQNKKRLTAEQYSRAKAAIAKAAKKFGIHSEYNQPATAAATDHLVPHMHVEATIPHGGNLHVRHLADDRRAVLSLDDAGKGSYLSTVALTDAPEDGPVWNQVACVGAFRGHPAGPFELNAKVFDEIVRNWEATGRKPIPVDYEHASEADATSGSIPVHGAPAQGWITELQNLGDRGLFGKFEWLPQARGQIRGGQYKFLSPAIRFESRDKVTGRPIGARLTSAALTNQPFLDNLAPVAAKATAKDLIAAKDAPMTQPTNTAAPGKGPAVAMQDMLESDRTHLVASADEYMPKLKACMGLHPLSTAEEMKDNLDRLRGLVSKCGGNLSAMVDGVQLGAYVRPMREAVGMTAASTTIEQIFDAVEHMIDAAIDQHVVEDHPEDTTHMDDASMVESDKQPGVQAAGYTDVAASMADKQEKMDMEKLAEKEAEVTRLTLQLSDKESEIAKLKTENQALAAFKAQREEQDLENDVAFVMTAHADKIAHLAGDDAAKKALLLKARKESPDFFWAQYPKDADPRTQYLLSQQTPPAPARTVDLGADQLEAEKVISLNEDVRATSARLRDEGKISYIDAYQKALRLHQLARQLAG